MKAYPVVPKTFTAFVLFLCLFSLSSFVSVSADTNWLVNGSNIYNSNSGNVGIGTNSPSSKLYILGNGISEAIKVDTGGPGANLSVKYGGSNEKVSLGSWSVGGLHFYTTCTGCGFDDPSNGAVQIYPRNGNFIARGNMAVGTTTFSEKLHVAGNIDLDAVGSPLLSSINFNNDDLIKYNDTENLWTFSSDTNTYFAINDSKIGIGTTNPGVSLHVFSGSNATLTNGGYLMLGNQDGPNLIMDNNEISARNNGAYSPLYLQALGSTANTIINSSGGNVGIGTATPESKLDVSGNIMVNAVGDKRITINNTQADGHSWSWANDWEARNSFSLIEEGVSGSIIFVKPGGNIGIGTVNPGTYKLAVNGSIRTKEIVVNTGWSDFVFEDNYQLRSLSEVETFINENNHLPDVPSAKDVEENGVSLGSMDSKLLQKIEELTLYTIDLEKRIKELENK